MNTLLTRFIVTAYRQEPISSFILLVGAVNILIGGSAERWTLLSLGVTTVVLAALIRWWQGQKKSPAMERQSARYYLAPSSSRPSLPLLVKEKDDRN